MPHLKLKIDCGETTCARDPGQFCDHLGARRFGTQFVCRLFPGDDKPYTVLHEPRLCGWLQRCEACMAAQVYP